MKSHASSPSVLLIALLSLLLAQVASAGSATWNLSPASGNWNTASNWTPATVPNGPSDTATFATSNKATISLSATTEVDSIVFAPDASAFTIHSASSYLPLNVSGVGVINNSAITQNFVVGKLGYLYFLGTATAGSGIIYTLTGDFGSSAIGFEGSSSAGDSTFIDLIDYIVFTDAATAANATFIIEGATSAHTGNGLVEFYTGTTAGNATFIINGGSADSAYSGELGFSGAKGGNSTITVNGGTAPNAIGGYLQFNTLSDAENATLIVNGGTNGGLPGTLFFIDTGRGGKARVEVFDTGELDMSYRPGGAVLVVGSIEGNGIVFLGGSELSVGSSHRSTIFSGRIKDGGIAGGRGGALSKRGSGKLSLVGANTYTGGTTVEGGALFVRNTTGSATGPGAVQINRGTLGGTGTISGAVTLGTTEGRPTLLAPGSSQSLGTLTIQKALTFNAGATYDFALNSSRSAADQVIANGVTIASGAVFSPIDNGTAILSPGTAFTPILNGAVTPISGIFSNLPDGATVTIGSNTFQVDYEGGDGNDLTLTVVP